MKKITPAMRNAIRVAASRERGNYCPTRGVSANAQMMLLRGLDQRGLIAWDNPTPAFGLSGSGAPRINDKARAAINVCEGDRKPCYVGGMNDKHHRCGTVQCGLSAALAR